MENNHTDKDAILAQWLNGDITSEEARKHLSDDEFRKYEQILTEVDQWVPDTDTSIFDTRSILKTEKAGKVVAFNNWRYFSVAASVVLALFVGLWLWQPWNTVTYQTAYGETLSIDLPDGTSTLVLGSNSSVSWEKTNWRRGKRRVALEGKAYLDVPQKGDFEVVTSEGTVSVLGTRFVVHQIEQALHAVCYEGRVRATSHTKKSVELKKGESSIFFKGKWDPKKLFNLELPEWLKDQLAFDNAPLQLVIQELVSTYGIEVKPGAIDMDRRFTGSIPKNDLEQSLKIIFPTLGITYRLEDNILYLFE